MNTECYECDKPIAEGVRRLSTMGNTIRLCEACDRVTPPYAGEWNLASATRVESYE